MNDRAGALPGERQDLVVYYSFTGNHAVLARELKHRLGCEAVRVTETERRSRLDILLDLAFRRSHSLHDPGCDLREYRRLVFVAPLWAGRIATPLAAFVDQERDNVGDYAFLGFCTGAHGQADAIREQLRGLTGREPGAVAQLLVHELLPPEQRHTVRHVRRYRTRNEDFATFGAQLDAFVRALHGRHGAPALGYTGGPITE